MLKNQLLFVLFLLGVASCAQAPTGVEYARACYLPFDYETYGPVTRETIDKYKCTSLMDKKDIRDQLTKYFSSKIGENKTNQSSFDEKRVRLKIEDSSKKSIFVDANGIVLSGDDIYKLTDEDLAAVSKILDKLFGYDD